MKRLILLLLLIPSLLFAGQGMGPGPGVKGYSGGSSSCSTSEIVPTATITSTNWAAYPSGTILDAIDELIAGRDVNDYAYINDFYHDYLTFRVSLPGNCDVTAIRAEIYADGAAASIAMDVDISKDDSTYTTAQSVALVANTPTAFPKTFSSLAWTTPAYCYVRFKTTTDTYNNARIYSLSITVNP
jgi:hypothetical protein